MIRFLRVIGAATSLAVTLGLGVAAPVSASASILNLTITQPLSDTGITDGCLPGQTGTLNGTAVLDIQVIGTPGAIHITFTEVDTGRIDWTNGDYTIIDSTSHDAGSGTPAGPHVFTLTHVESDYVYDAGGNLLFTETVEEVTHLTLTDGTPTVQFDKAQVNVIGSDCTP